MKGYKMQETKQKNVIVKLTDEHFNEFKKLCNEKGSNMSVEIRQFIVKEINLKKEKANDK